MRLYATDVLIKTGDPMANINALASLRHLYGEPLVDEDGRSYWNLPEDVLDLYTDATNCEISS